MGRTADPSKPPGIEVPTKPELEALVEDAEKRGVFSAAQKQARYYAKKRLDPEWMKSEAERKQRERRSK